MKEVWKDAVGLEDYVKVSNLGNVITKSRFVKCNTGMRFLNERIHKGTLDSSGYRQHAFRINGAIYRKQEHTLVAEAFIPKPISDEILEVNHKDGDKENNQASNLEWVTHIQNIEHALNTGLIELKDWGESICPQCSDLFKLNRDMNTYCSLSCANISQVNKIKPTKETLYNLLTFTSFIVVGEIFGVSNNTIRKWCITYDIPNKTRYYRNKYYNI